MLLQDGKGGGAFLGRLQHRSSCFHSKREQTCGKSLPCACPQIPREAAEAARRLLRKFFFRQAGNQAGALYLGKELAGLMEGFLKPYFPRSFLMRPWRVWRSVLQRRAHC